MGCPPRCVTSSSGSIPSRSGRPGEFRASPRRRSPSSSWRLGKRRRRAGTDAAGAARFRPQLATRSAVKVSLPRRAETETDGRDVPRGTSLRSPGGRGGRSGGGERPARQGDWAVTAAPDVPYLERVLADAGIVLPDGGAGKLVVHAAELLRWNRAIRLTAITGPVDVAVKHVLDSLFLLRFAPYPGRTLDAGSGAGYPGIPLAVALPESRFVLLDATAKKCAFLSHVC